jgi:hypothetical protein
LHDRGRLPLERRLVDRPFAGDDEVVASRVEADQIEHELRAGDELGAERCKRRSEAAGGARAGDRAVRVSRERTLELRYVVGRGPLLRPEQTRRVGELRLDVAGGARRQR